MVKKTKITTLGCNYSEIISDNRTTLSAFCCVVAVTVQFVTGLANHCEMFRVNWDLLHLSEPFAFLLIARNILHFADKIT